MIGETLSHYRILEKLGAGSMGTVYKAEDTRLNRLVALKLLSVADTESETARLRFLREAQAASAINHPNIATIYEIDEAVNAGTRYSFIAMEYVPGATLKSLQGSFSPAELLDLFQQITEGLCEAHERGIVHRDLKPSNILVADLGETRRAKVLDFGVAKFNPLTERGEADTAGDTASLFHTNLLKTVPGTVLGTFAYMSPEQALGNDVDHRSDIFSLGIVFYEMLTGRLPFQGSSALAVVDAILHATPVALSAFNRDVSPVLEDLVHRMLAKDRALRYQHLREVLIELDALQQLVSMRGVPARETQRTDDLYATRADYRPPNSNALQTRQSKSVAVLRFYNITGNAPDDWIGVGIAETVTADLKNIQGVSVIGRELIYDVLRRWNADQQADFDEQFATRVGREVSARWIIGGGYQRFGEMLRITARFVEVETGEVIKTVKVDGTMSQIFELQDKIVYELSRDLDWSLRSGERADIEEKETQVIEAYEAYIKARTLVYSASAEKIEEAIALLEKAVALDPSYAQAYAGLAYTLTLKGQSLHQPEFIERAITQAEKAIELRPNLAESYSVIGFAFIALDRVSDAVGALKRALAFAPDDSLVHSSLGRAYFIGKGDFKAAAAEYELALINPTQATWITPALAQVLLYTGDYARAEDFARQAILSQEEYRYNQEGLQIIGAYSRLAQALYLQGRYDEALAACYNEIAFAERSNHVLKDRVLIEVRARLTAVLFARGEIAQAHVAFDTMMKDFNARLARGADDPFTRYYIACGCAVVGEDDQAFEHLFVAIAGRRAFNIARARVEKDFETLRDDPRWQTLIEEPHEKS
jgi:non-specific serine/threonine protein kinase